MKLNHLTVALATFTALALAAGCDKGSDDTEATETPAAESPPEGASAGAADEAQAEAPAAEAEAADPAAEGASGGGSTCEKAQSCCEAYVNAVAGNTPGVNVETTCAAVKNAQGPAADATCQAAINGWRTGLQAAQLDVPSACAGE